MCQRVKDAIEENPNAVCVFCRRLRFDDQWSDRFATIIAVVGIPNKGICWECNSGKTHKKEEMKEAKEILDIWGPPVPA